MNNPELAAADIIAITSAFKDKEISDAKRSLPDGSSHQVDITVRIAGMIQKGVGQPETTSTNAPFVTLATLPAFCAVLRVLGIGSKRLEAALSSLPPAAKLEPDAEFKALFDAAAERQASRLPAITSTKPGTAGRVTSTLSVERL